VLRLSKRLLRRQRWERTLLSLCCRNRRSKLRPTKKN